MKMFEGPHKNFYLQDCISGCASYPTDWEALNACLNNLACGGITYSNLLNSTGPLGGYGWQLRTGFNLIASTTINEVSYIKINVNVTLLFGIRNTSYFLSANVQSRQLEFYEVCPKDNVLDIRSYPSVC